MKNCEKLGKVIELCKENDIAKISVKILNNWSEPFVLGTDTIESYSYKLDATYDNPFNSDLEEFNEEILLEMSDIAKLYDYTSHMEVSSKRFIVRSIETNGKVYYFSVFPLQQTKDKIKIALEIIKFQYQPSMEKTIGIIFFPFSFKSYLEYFLERFLSEK
ncbi:MAG: hypothetical protein JHC31_06620 [Sulfurihydrogenibium sp.]|jgi:hypothetical protein|nr:hypothetical protein [Sulfurihydrogenibium sp.]